MAKFPIKYIPHLVAGFFWAALVAVFFAYKYGYDISNQEIIRGVYHFLKGEDSFSWLVFLVIYAARILIFFPLPLLILFAPSLYGVVGAFVLVVIGENLSSLIGYFLGRLYGKDLLSKDTIRKFRYLKESLKKDSFGVIFPLRMLFVPFDPLCYLSGFFRAEFVGYFWATLLGTIPGILIFLFVGAGIRNVDRFDLESIDYDRRFLIPALAVACFSLAFTLIHNRRRKSRS